MFSCKLRRAVFAAVMGIPVALMLSSCGFFSPREGKLPLGGISDDPFRIRDVLEIGTNQTFQRLAYEDMFSDAFVFEDSYGKPTDHSGMVGHLNVLAKSYVTGTGNDAVKVLWSVDPTVGSFTSLATGDTASLFRVYQVTYPQWSDTLRGSARITVAYNDAKNTWSILFWKDTPQREPGFFSPDFQGSTSGN